MSDVLAFSISMSSSSFLLCLCEDNIFVVPYLFLHNLLQPKWVRCWLCIKFNEMWLASHINVFGVFMSDVVSFSSSMSSSSFLLCICEDHIFVLPYLFLHNILQHQGVSSWLCIKFNEMWLPSHINVFGVFMSEV